MAGFLDIKKSRAQRPKAKIFAFQDQFVNILIPIQLICSLPYFQSIFAKLNSQFCLKSDTIHLPALSNLRPSFQSTTKKR